MSMSYAPHKLRPPEGLEELLWSFAKEVLRDQPEDIVKHGARYFRAAYNERENPSPKETGPPPPVTIVREPAAEASSSSQQEAAAPAADRQRTLEQQPPAQPSKAAPNQNDRQTQFSPQEQAGQQQEPVVKPQQPSPQDAAVSHQQDVQQQRREAASTKAQRGENKTTLSIDQQKLLEKVAPDEASKDALDIIKDKEQMKSLWNRVDYNNNGIVSLAELDKLVVEKGWNISKPALMRAYKKTTLKDGDGDAWVERKEFAACIRNMFFFDRLWDVFDDIDTGDDRRIDVGEFKAGMEKLGSRLSEEEAQAEFAKIDRNGGGQILFKEFCRYVASLVGASLEGDKEQFKEDTDRGAKASSGAATGSKADATPSSSVPAKDGLNEEGLLAKLGLDEASKDALDIIKDKEQMKSLWNRVDYNNNGIVSLAELDKLVVEKGWNISKPALMRAYKKTTLKDGDGDAWVERKEFAACIRNMFFFDRLWDVFDDIDTGDDRRIDVGEFKAGMEKLGSRLSEEEAQAEFAKIDRNGGGQILFLEFCHYVSGLVGVDLEDFTMT